MPFTNDDLKRLKECVNPQTQSLKIGLYRFQTARQWEEEPMQTSAQQFDLVALLNRLGAAERKGRAASELQEAGKAICDPATYSLLEREFELADKAWRKECGK